MSRKDLIKLIRDRIAQMTHIVVFDGIMYGFDPVRKEEIWLCYSLQFPKELNSIKNRKGKKK